MEKIPQEYILECLAEECAEVQKVKSKIIRFGINSEYNGISNLDLLVNELYDLIEVIELLKDNNQEIEIKLVEKLVNDKGAKKKKVLDFFKNHKKQS